MEELDLIIIGAGWNGIAMAKTYHEVYPTASIRVIDSARTVGGSWAAERIYRGLNTNNILGSYEFSDFPMTPDIVGASPGDHIPGAGVHKYLCQSVKQFGIEPYLQLQTRVDSASLRSDDVWVLSLSSTNSGSSSKILAKKLVLATGLTSEPFMPVFAGQNDFGSLLIHSKQLCTQSNELSQAKNVVVIGGNKSAWDVCYSVASSGGKAHMIIRPSGSGPSWVWPRQIRFLNFGTSLSKLSLTRFWTLFDPWPFGVCGTLERRVKNFLHTSSLGRIIVNGFWTLLGYCARSIHGYGTHLTMKALKPWNSTFWMGNSASTLNYPTDWFAHARGGRISLHHADVISLSERCVHLTDVALKEIDALVCCTGWTSTPTVQFEPPEARSLLGLPGPLQSTEERMASRAREHLLVQFPYLEDATRSIWAPELVKDKLFVKSPTGPYRLYRFMVPGNEAMLTAKNLAFIGIDFSLHTLVLAQAQALWITAFFHDDIKHLQSPSIDFDKVKLETILMSEFEKLRRPRIAGGSGEKFPDLVFESLPYVDMLLQDLGLRTRRKAGWLEDLFSPYGLKDYQNLVLEWKYLSVNSVARKW